MTDARPKPPRPGDSPRRRDCATGLRLDRPWARREVLRGAGLLAGGLALPALPRRVFAQEEETGTTFFRIATASTAGTYFPVGGLIANAISNPPGGRECERGGHCGVPGLIAVVQSTAGSVDNVERIVEGSTESGFVQADVAYWAFRGQEMFSGEKAAPGLRALANLYPEAIHLVVSGRGGIRSVEDLRGKRVSLDLADSGTFVDARLILEAYGLSEEDLEVLALSAGDAADALRKGEIDAFFFVAGTPANAIADLAQEVGIDLVPIAGEPARKLVKDFPFFTQTAISAGTYQKVTFTPTLSVGAQWVVSETLEEELAYALMTSLWHETTRKLLDSGHPKGRLIRLETALKGLSIPLHPGAARYYRAAGILTDSVESKLPKEAEAPTSGRGEEEKTSTGTGTSEKAD